MRFFKSLNDLKTKIVFASASITALMFKVVGAEGQESFLFDTKSIHSNSTNSAAEDTSYNSKDALRLMLALSPFLLWAMAHGSARLYHFCQRRDENLDGAVIEEHFDEEANILLLSNVAALQFAFQQRMDENAFLAPVVDELIDECKNVNLTCPITLASYSEISLENRVFITTSDGAHTFLYDYNALLAHIQNCDERSILAFHPETGREGLLIHADDTISIGFPAQLMPARNALVSSETRINIRM